MSYKHTTDSAPALMMSKPKPIIFSITLLCAVINIHLRELTVKDVNRGLKLSHMLMTESLYINRLIPVMHDWKEEAWSSQKNVTVSVFFSVCFQ